LTFLVVYTRNLNVEKYVTATEANQRFAEVLREVSAGESFAVTSRGRVVAEISPPRKKRKKKSTKEFLAYLESQPNMKGIPWKREDLYDRSDRDIP
jgi:prevent-host-death family protein